MNNKYLLPVSYRQGCLWLWLLVLLFSGSCTAQVIPGQPTGPTEFTEAVAIDRLNNIYLADRRNNLHKFDDTGKLVATYSPPATGHIALIDAWSASKILLFYDDQQKAVFLDRFLTPIGTIRLSDYVDGLIKAASFSSDNKLWAFNESNFSLHKIDLSFPETSRTVPLDLLLNKQQYDIRFIREYQNKVYLLDKASGIYVFDNMGNYQKKLPFSDLFYIGFRGDELYYLAEGKLHFFHLYTLKERTLDLPPALPAHAYRQALVGETNLYLISATGLKVVPL